MSFGVSDRGTDPQATGVPRTRQRCSVAFIALDDGRAPRRVCGATSAEAMSTNSLDVLGCPCGSCFDGQFSWVRLL